MSYFLQTATSATKEWLVLHHLRKTQRSVWLFSSELTLQSEHLITAVIQDCTCSKRQAATTKVMEMKKKQWAKKPTPLQFIHQTKKSKSSSPAKCQWRGEGTAYLSRWHIIARKTVLFKMLIVFTQDKKSKGWVFFTSMNQQTHQWLLPMSMEGNLSWILQKWWWLLFICKTSISPSKGTKPKFSKQKISVLNTRTNKNMKSLTQKDPSCFLKPFDFHSAGISLGICWVAVRKTHATGKIREPLGSLPFLRTWLPSKKSFEMNQ